MKVLLVNPRPSLSLYSVVGVQDVTGCPGYMPNLALPTLAALTPRAVDLTLADASIGSIDHRFDEPWDLVGITGYVTQKQHMFAIADEFRRRGRLVAIGGPYATLSSATVRPHADVLFVGEAERTWPQFLGDFERGSWKNEYRDSEVVDLATSPTPEFRNLRPDDYWVGVLQTSRGCPFECEFCDVIVYLGRRQRYKSAEQSVRELAHLQRAGFRAVFIADDNFTVHRKKATAIMRAIAAWNARQRERLSFTTQMSIDAARDPDLLRLCAAAGLSAAFIGIETPNEAALREVKKRQNVRDDLVADVHAIQQQGIAVQAGIICGFDSDTVDSFRTQFAFCQAAGVPVVLVNALNAPEGTKLEQRLLQERRLKATPVDDGGFGTNIIPKQMTEAELRVGLRWLLNRLYAPDAFLERIAILAENLPPSRGYASTARRFAHLWHGVTRAYERLGPEFRRIPRESVRLFRGKETGALAAALIYYKSVVRVLQTTGLWAPGLATFDRPPFRPARRGQGTGRIIDAGEAGERWNQL